MDPDSICYIYSPYLSNNFILNLQIIFFFLNNENQKLLKNYFTL